MEQRVWGRPVHTYSIVACDSSAGELGVAVQSHWFNVGPVVAWAEPGVGAVATQSFANVSFGPRGLALMRSGADPAVAIETLLADDTGREVRQVAMVDADERVAVHTGSGCIAWASHATGDGWSAQANIMENPGVPEAMGTAYETTEAPLADRLMAALEAAQEVGGDLRGKQSGAMRVVSAEQPDDPSEGFVLDLRVEDHAEPLVELRRLMETHGAYARMNAGDAAMERGDFEEAKREYATASEILPGNTEIQFWSAFTLSKHSGVSESVAIFRDIFAREPRWVDLLRRLPNAGLADDHLVATILAEAAETRGGTDEGLSG